MILNSKHRRGAFTAVASGLLIDKGIEVEQLRASSAGLPLQLPFWADTAGWTNPSYYATIQLADIDGDGQAELIARGPAGVLSNHFDVATGQWLTLTPGPANSDANGWNAPYSYMSMQCADLDGDGAEELFVLSSTGVQIWKYMTTSSGAEWVWYGSELTALASYMSQPQYYLTIQAADLDGDGCTELFARGPDGIHVWKFTQAGWTELTTPQTVLPLSDADGWDNAQYYSTIQAADIDGDGSAELIARAADGLHFWKFNGTSWLGTSAAQTLTALSDANGWSQAPYYTTIQTADLTGSGHDQLIARYSDGIHVWEFSQTSLTWTELTTPQTVLPLVDTAGWNQPQYYSTLQAADIDGDGSAELIARAADGLQFWKFNGMSWSGNSAAQTLTAMSDANGWDQPCYYSTIQTGVLNKNMPGVSMLIARSGQSIQNWAWNTATLQWDTTSEQIYPQFLGDQLTAYQSISLQLGVASNAGIRSEYNDNIAPLTDFYTRLTEGSLERPSGVSIADWHSVLTELATEVQNATNVQAYFAQTNSLINEIFLSDQMNVSYVQNILSIPSKDNGTNVFFDFAEVLTNTAWAALGVAAPEASVCAGLLASAFGAMIDAEGGVADITAAVASLEKELKTQFNNVLNANGTQQSIVIADWSLLSSIGGMITSGAWNWSSTYTPQYVAVGQYQYQLSLWQTLIPVVWVLCYCEHAYIPRSYPTEYLYKAPNSPNYYWFSTNHMSVSFPALATLDALFGSTSTDLNVPLEEVVNGINGWPKLTTYDFNPPSPPGPGPH
jgi:FG-GAP-like repeat